MVRQLIILLVIMSTHLAEAKSPPLQLKVQKERAVVIAGPIGRGNIIPLGAELLKFTEKSKQPVDIIINSPGGELMTGKMFLSFIEAVKSKGVKIRCFVPGVAASLAFTILVHCDERYALESGLLLWHGARVILNFQPITAELAQSLYNELTEANGLILKDILRALEPGLSRQRILQAFLEEKMWAAGELEAASPKFLKVYKHIPGLLETIMDPNVPSNVEITGLNFNIPVHIHKQ